MLGISVLLQQSHASCTMVAAKHQGHKDRRVYMGTTEPGCARESVCTLQGRVRSMRM